MRACHFIQITTPKKVELNGLWWGNPKARRAIIWVHGLGSSMFSKLDIVEKLLDKKTAVITFNNRGHDIVSRVRKGRRSILAGMGKEIFTECADDIQGVVNFAKRRGAREIYLAGSSTGCQKSVYWASQKGRGVKGIILLAPISDYAGDRKEKNHSRALAEARALLRKGKTSALVTSYPGVMDAQRYVSLYSGESAEEVFPYWDARKMPKALRRIRQPLLVLLAGSDEYADRPAVKIQDWFAEHLKEGDQIHIIPGAEHGFEGREEHAARIISDFMQKS